MSVVVFNTTLPLEKEELKMLETTLLLLEFQDQEFQQLVLVKSAQWPSDMTKVLGLKTVEEISLLRRNNLQ